MSRSTLGLAITPNEVGAVLLRDGACIWRESLVVTDEPGGLGQALLHLLAAAPGGRFMRPRVRVAIGPFAAQFKPLAGVPDSATASDVRRAVEANLTRFFVRNGKPVLFAGLGRECSGWWGAAVREDVIEAISAACDARGLRLDGCVPAIVVASSGASGDAGLSEVVLSEGRRRIRATLREGRFESIEGAMAHADATSAIALAEQAARISTATPYLFDPRRAVRDMRRTHAVRLILVAVTMVALIVAALAPWIRAIVDGGLAEWQLSALGDQASGPREDAARLAQVRASVAILDDFTLTRVSALGDLSALTSRFPDSTAIVSIRLDLSSVTFVALTSRASDLLAALESVKGFSPPQTVGAVTRETVAGRELQRIALTMRRLSATPSISGTPEEP